MQLPTAGCFRQVSNVKGLSMTLLATAGMGIDMLPAPVASNGNKRASKKSLVNKSGLNLNDVVKDHVHVHPVVAGSKY